MFDEIGGVPVVMDSERMVFAPFTIKRDAEFSLRELRGGVPVEKYCWYDYGYAGKGGES